jgi:hypothetical protein
VTAFSADVEAEVVVDLLGGLDAELDEAAVLEQAAAALGDHGPAGDLVPVLLDHPGGPEAAAGLLVGVEHEDEVAGEGRLESRDEAEGLDEDGGVVLVVEGAAAPDEAVAEFGGEGVRAPPGAVDADDVDMGHEEEGRSGAGSADAGDEVAAAGGGLEDVGGDAVGGEDGGDAAQEGGLVGMGASGAGGRRVGGVDPDQIAEEFDGVAGGAGFIEGGGAGGAAGQGGGEEGEGGGAEHRASYEWN